MKDQIDLKLSPSVCGSYMIKVPCSFSPTGIHYITIMTGEKTRAVSESQYGKAHWRPRRFPFLMHASCECVDTVPKETLDGMIDLRAFAAAERMARPSPICVETLRMCRRLLSSQCGVDTYEKRAKFQREIVDLPQPLQPVLSFLVEKKLVRHSNPVLSPLDVWTRAARRFTTVFNAATFPDSPEDTPFQIHAVDTPSGKCFALGTRGRYLAYRKGGKWYLPKNWQGSYSADRWAEHTQAGSLWCAICAKKFDGGNYRNGAEHNSHSASHVLSAQRQAKVGLHCTQFFPKLLERPNRVPRTFNKSPNVVELPMERFKSLFHDPHSSTVS